MKTDALIAMLARGPIVGDRQMVARRLSAAAAVGTILAFLAMLGVLGLRPDIAQAAATPMFWVKLALPGVLLLVSLAAVGRLARPGDRATGAVWLAAAVLCLLWLAAAAELVAAPTQQRQALIVGATALPCVVSIALLSLPSLAASVLALRGLAPTRVRAAGAAAGALAGSAAAAVYALHCTEATLPFLATWYVLGIAFPAALTAAAAPRLLRWG